MISPPPSQKSKLFLCVCGGRGGGILLFGRVSLGEPYIRRFFFRKNSESAKLFEIRRIFRVFHPDALCTYINNFELLYFN